MMSDQIVYCCGCEKAVKPRLTDGKEIYPHRKDLYSLPFWKCDNCGNYVGCHHKTKTPTKPLGSIPTPEVRKIRQGLHKSIDEVWRDLKLCSRKRLYKLISKHLGREFHSANVNNKDEASEVLKAFELAFDELA